VPFLDDINKYLGEYGKKYFEDRLVLEEVKAPEKAELQSLEQQESKTELKKEE